MQGIEAGGHRASFVDDEGAGDYGLLALLQLVGAHVDLPLVASGAIASGGALAAVLCAGAQAAQIGTAFMRCPEAGTAPAHRAALAADAPTRLTRAFTGRQARGIVNRFLREHSADAPPAYPEIHHVTAPLRAAGRAAGDADMINLWAGQAHELAREAPAAEVVAALAAEARERLEAARRALDGSLIARLARASGERLRAHRCRQVLRPARRALHGDEVLERDATRTDDTVRGRSDRRARAASRTAGRPEGSASRSRSPSSVSSVSSRDARERPRRPGRRDVLGARRAAERAAPTSTAPSRRGSRDRSQ